MTEERVNITYQTNVNEPNTPTKSKIFSGCIKVHNPTTHILPKTH